MKRSGIVYQGLGVHPSDERLTLEEYSRADVVSLTDAVEGKIVYKDNLAKLRQTHPYLESLLLRLNQWGWGYRISGQVSGVLTTTDDHCAC